MPRELEYPIWEFLVVEGKIMWGYPSVGSIGESIDFFLMGDGVEHLLDVRIFDDGHAEVSQYIGEEIIWAKDPFGVKRMFHESMWISYSPLRQGWGGLSPVNAGIHAFPR